MFTFTAKMSRPTISQLEALVDFLEQNPEIAKGQLRTVQAKQEAKRKWASLAITLNALGGADKDGAGWMNDDANLVLRVGVSKFSQECVFQLLLKQQTLKLYRNFHTWLVLCNFFYLGPKLDELFFS